MPWRKSNDLERLDVGNGIILSPNLDALFDKHLITFEDDGRIRISKKLSQNHLVDLGITDGLKLRQVLADMFKYLAVHREEFSKSEKF